MEPSATALGATPFGPTNLDVTVQNSIRWPERYLPGAVDNFVSNEVVVSGLSAEAAWRLLVDTSTWESYYDNVSDISFPEHDGPELRDGIRFTFRSFGFPPIDAHVVEFQPPAHDRPGRLSWTGLLEGGPAERAEALHAWLVEDLPGGRGRILTQETQIGEPARALAAIRPNPVLNGHQDWLEGLVEAARK